MEIGRYVNNDPFKELMQDMLRRFYDERRSDKRFLSQDYSVCDNHRTVVLHLLICLCKNGNSHYLWL